MPKRLIAVLLALVLLGGCSRYGSRYTEPTSEPEMQVTEDTRESALPEEFVTQAEALYGVESVEQVESTEFVVELDVDARAEPLSTTAEELHSLVNDYVYGESKTIVEVRSGQFSGRVGVGMPGMPEAGWHPEPLPLEELPFLHELPGVEEGDLGIGGDAEVVIAADEPIDDWVSDVVSREADFELTAVQDRGEGREQASFELDLANRALEDDLQKLFDTAEDILVEVIGWSATGSSVDLPATVEVADKEDVEPVFEDFATAYSSTVEGLRFATHDGLIVVYVEETGPDGSRSGGAGPEGGRVADYFAAADELRERGAMVTEVNMSADSFTVSVEDTAVLGTVVDYVSSSGWPLHGDTTLIIHPADEDSIDEDSVDEDRRSYFHVSEWQQHADLLAALWEADFTAVKVRDSHGEKDADLVVEVDEAEGTDNTDPAVQKKIITTLRSTGWQGVATVRIIAGGYSLDLNSTETGEAEGAEMRTSDGSVEPTGWGDDFIAEWNASAE